MRRAAVLAERLCARLPSARWSGMNAQNLFLVIAGANAISLAVFVAARLPARLSLSGIAAARGRSGVQPPTEAL
jgi:hypothetical protein